MTRGVLEFRSSGDQSLASLIRRELLKVLDVARGEVFGFLFPCVLVGIGVARVEDVRVYDRKELSEG